MFEGINKKNKEKKTDAKASDKGCQPYSRAVRYGEPTVTVREARESKWLVRKTPTHGTLLICKGQYQIYVAYRKGRQ